MSVLFWNRFVAASVCVLLFVLMTGQASAAEFRVGAASIDITPSEPAALDGQMHTRISQKVETPVTANAIVLESRDGDTIVDLAVLVSCDAVTIPVEFLGLVRQAAQKRVPELVPEKIVLNATHTHTAPTMRPGRYAIPETGVTTPEGYRAFAAERVAEAIEKAWQSRTPGSVTWGLSHAVVAQNRRAVYADGKASMYGKTNQANFRGLEGYEDHDVNTLFFWNNAGQLVAICVNIACPSQEVEGLSVIHADFWHNVRESLHKQYGANVCVLGWAGAAGDQSPHLMVRKDAEERMRTLRKLSRLEELSRRIVDAVNDAYSVVQNDRHSDVPLIHNVEKLRLPMRVVTEAEYTQAKKMIETLQAPSEQWRRNWYGRTVERFEALKTDPHPMFEADVHVIRLGDIAICTNTFELFTDYGIQMKARNKALQTFVIQLAGQGGSYLPSQRAVLGGSYSAIVESNFVGPEGGQVLVDRTVEMVNSLWPEAEKPAK